ncbi:MAG: helix-turn-helix domain-containing protein [Actinomycetota bacterium]|nr:helix-turn-helix domain-containing protein [Actinomycetota bacterium]
MSERTHRPVFPGMDEVAERRQALRAALVAHRVAQGLSQTEVAAGMRTSQSSVARFEVSAGDLRLSTLERYAAAVGQRLDWSLEAPDAT